MAAVGAINQVAPQQAHFQPNAKDTRVTEVSKPIFQRLKETLVRVWSATVIGVKASFGKVSFVFFRVLEWIYPSLGFKIENIFLRVGNIFQSIKEAWKQEETRKEIDGLRIQNRDLQAKVQLLSGASEQNERLKFIVNQQQGEFDRLKHDHEFNAQIKNSLEQRVQGFLQQQNHIVEREQAVVQQRDIFVARNEELQQQNTSLTLERNAASQALCLALVMNKEFQQKFSFVEREAIDLRAQAQNNQSMRALLEQISTAGKQVRQLGQKTELDYNLEDLLSLLLTQIKGANEKLKIAKEGLPRTSSAHGPLQTFERTLPEIIALLEGIPSAFKLHANYQQQVDLLFNLNHQMVEV